MNKTIKLCTFTGHTTMFNKRGLYVYNIKIIDNKRFITEYNNYNQTMLISNTPLKLGVLDDVIKYYNDVNYVSASEILKSC